MYRIKYKGMKIYKFVDSAKAVLQCSNRPPTPKMKPRN